MNKEIIKPVRFLSKEQKEEYIKEQLLYTADEIPFGDGYIVEKYQNNVVSTITDTTTREEEYYYQVDLPYYTGFPIDYSQKVDEYHYLKGAAHHDFQLEDIVNIPNISWSIDKCRTGVNWKDSTIEFALHKAEHLNDIMKSFYTDKLYLSDYYHTEIMERGKLRLICSLTFRDRVITKCINQKFVLPAFVNTLVFDNAASLKGKGIVFAANRLYYHMECMSRKYEYFYILKTDISSYFDNISHVYIYNLITKHSSDERLLKFFKLYFKKAYYDPYIHNGEQVPYGVGLGSEVSQSIGIICLNELDHIAEEKFRLKMVRYMDDTVYLSESKEKLINFLEYSRGIISKMGLRYNEYKTGITDCYQGVTFLKLHYKLSKEVKNYVYAVPLKKGIKKARKKLFKMHELLINGEIDFGTVRCSYNSYRGHISKSNSNMLVNIFDQLFEELFINDPEAYPDNIIIPGRRRTVAEEKEYIKETRKEYKSNFFRKQSNINKHKKEQEEKKEERRKRITDFKEN